MTQPRRQILRLLASAATLSMAGVARAQAFPNKPITIVVPWPPGAATDAATRFIADAMSRDLGQPVVVENRPGASGALGSAYVASGPKDGYRLVTATADTHTINPQVRKSLSYDANRDFEPLALFATLSIVWVARPELPYRTMAELVAAAKQRSTPLSYGTWGVGSTAHMAGALLEMAGGVEFNHVPFQGAAPAVTALGGGHVDMMPFIRTSSAQMRATGKVKVLGVATAKRLPGELADVPTLAEQGIQGAESSSWYGLMAPKGIPEDVRARLTASINKVLATPDLREKIAGTGLDPLPLSGAEFRDYLKQQWDTVGRVIRAKQIVLND